MVIHINNMFIKRGKHIEFSTESEKHGGNQQILMAIRDSDLKNDDMLTSFYEHIIDVFVITS